jgi:hypothetical protein
VQEVKTREGLRDLRLPVAGDFLVGEGEVDGSGSVSLGIGAWQRTLDEGLQHLSRVGLAELLAEQEEEDQTEN